MLHFFLALSCRSPKPEAPPAPAPVTPDPRVEESLQPPRWLQQAHLIVLAEVTSLEAAKARLAEVKRVLDLVKPVIATRALYPKIVASDEVKSEPALAPGAYLVIAGACSQRDLDEE